MSTGAATSRIVSHVLASEIAKKVREQGIVVWLDADHNYDSFVDDLAAPEFPYPVKALRGSYLELMFALKDFGNGLTPEHLLVHLPGLNKDSVKETPVYELCAAGSVFEKNLGTLIREAAIGHATLDQIDARLRTKLTLTDADKWLDEIGGQPREGIALLTQSLGVDDTVMDLLQGGKRLAPYLPDEGDALLDFLEKGIGLTPAWRTYRTGDATLKAETLLLLVANWLMAVEFVHDLKGHAVTTELRALENLGPLAKVSRRLASRFREQLPDTYEEFANGFQAVIDQERTSHHAEALGNIDTFRFEESTTRGATIAAARNQNWTLVDEFAASRTPERCFWVKRSTGLQRTWDLLRMAAAAGQAFGDTAKALDRCQTVEEAAQRYVEKLAVVDREHRRFEQRAHAVLSPDLEDYDALLEVRGAVREAHRKWTDALNRRFFQICRARGPLPDSAFRQRNIYQDVIQPMLERGGRVAFFMVDALRFEMAQGLAEELKREKFQVHLTARLSELPSETSVGMNVLAPVTENGRLRVVLKKDRIEGFKTQEFAVCEPNARVRRISQFSLTAPAADLLLESFRDMSLVKLKRQLAGKPQLVVVRSTELDEAGESNLHLGTFDQTLTLLKSAISLLSQADVDRFVICSDHGFLMQDSTTANREFGASKRVPQRRHALLEEPSGMSDVLEVRLSDLDYDVEIDRYLVFAPDTAVWKKQDDVPAFVHGGNSLQERVVPVLQLEKPVARGKTTSKYEVVAHPEPSHLGRQRLRLSVRLQDRETATLGFLAPKAISLSLRVPGRNDLLLTILEAPDPAQLADGRILLPPNREDVVVEFEIQGSIDEKVRVEVFHPDAIEDVTPKTVEGFFDVARKRKISGAFASPVSAKPNAPGVPLSPKDWADLIEDESYRRVVKIIEKNRSINEEELQQVLGSPMRVRAFARNFDTLVKLLPFDVEILTVNGMKAYARRD